MHMGNKEVSKLQKMIDSLNRRVEKIKDPASCWCSFCGKEQSEVDQLFGGPVDNLYICDECVTKCFHKLRKE